MSKPISPIGHRWEDVEDEFMNFLTPQERAGINRSVAALGELLDARDAGQITEAEFDAAFDALEGFEPVAMMAAYT